MSEQEYINIKDASEAIAIPEKYLDNYVKVGKEIQRYRVGRRKLLSKEDFDKWVEQRNYGYIELSKADYLLCLDFAIRSFYHYRSTSDFGTSQQRDAGKFITNFVIGKLGEIAVERFLKRNLDIDTRLDFELREAVVGQDITEIAKPRRGSRVYNPPNLRIAIKTSKMKNVWLIVPSNEAEDSVRRSDIYIYSRVDLHLDHLIRILREHEALSDLVSIIPPFTSFGSEVCGFIERDILTSNSAVKKLPSPKQDIHLSYIYRSGELKKSKEDWQDLIDKL